MTMSNAGSSSWEGMNPEVVQVQARILHGLAEEITALMNKVEAEVAQLSDVWHGADANLFAADWAGTHKPVFATAATLLATMADTSLRNAAQQQAASAH